MASTISFAAGAIPGTGFPAESRTLAVVDCHLELIPCLNLALRVFIEGSGVIDMAY